MYPIVRMYYYILTENEVRKDKNTKSQKYNYHLILTKISKAKKTSIKMKLQMIEMMNPTLAISLHLKR